MGHTAHNGDVEIRDLRELVRIIWLGGNGLTEIFADLVNVHIDSEREFDIADVVPAQPGVHDSRDGRVIRRLFVELDSLYERGGAVPHADDGDTYFFRWHRLVLLDSGNAYFFIWHNLFLLISWFWKPDMKSLQ